MRKITQEAVNAFLNKKSFIKGNMKIDTFFNVSENIQESRMYLHGFLIAVYKDNIEISTAGWNTTTTKERLRGIPGVRLSTVKGDMILNGKIWDGSWITI